MIITKLLVVSLTIHVLNTSSATQFLQNSLLENKSVFKSVCQIINSITNLKSETQDVLVGYSDRKDWSSRVNNILQCIGDKNIVVVTDLRNLIKVKSLRKAAVMVLVLSTIDQDSVEKIIYKQKHSTVFHHMSKVICIPPISSTIKQRVDALGVFLGLGYLDVAMVYKTSSDNIFYELFKSFAYVVRITENPIDALLIFPDKLADLHGLHYNIPYYFQPPVIKFKNGLPSSRMIFFLEAIKKAQNAEIDLIFLTNSSQLLPLWLSRSMHLTINSGIDTKLLEPKLLTYEKKSYCALIPIPPQISVFYIIFIKPFDSFSWLFFGLSFISFVTLWRLFRGRGAVDSHWQIAFGIFTMFIGQGANFSRGNRAALAILLNIVSFETFLFSNFYESAITSLMIEPRSEHRLQTIDDLLNSDFEINGDPLFEYTMRNSNLMQAMAPRFNTLTLLIVEDDDHVIIDQRYVFIRTCDVAESTLTHKLSNGHIVSEYYYLLIEELSWQFIQLEASYLNPFLERFQYYMDLSFQAGLPQMWKILAAQDYSQFFKAQIKDERSFLELQDLVSVFGFLLFGVSLSAMVLLVEIFYHDCARNLNADGSNIWCRIKKMFSKKKKKKVKHPKVRKIVVRPQKRHQ